MMKKLLLLAALLLGCGALKAQDLPATVSPADTLAPLNVYTVDSTLVGRSIFNLLPDQVKVHQSDAIRAAILRRANAQEDKAVSGYRVRIFFDNKQTSRADSEAALIRFRSSYPDIPAYRNFSNSFFRVTVGDFRTKSEALRLLSKIKYEFPAAFLVHESINYPAVNPVQ